jgi:hypothetical protein
MVAPFEKGGKNGVRHEYRVLTRLTCMEDSAAEPCRPAGSSGKKSQALYLFLNRGF